MTSNENLILLLYLYTMNKYTKCNTALDSILFYNAIGSGTEYDFGPPIDYITKSSGEVYRDRIFPNIEKWRIIIIILCISILEICVIVQT